MILEAKSIWELTCIAGGFIGFKFNKSLPLKMSGELYNRTDYGGFTYKDPVY